MDTVYQTFLSNTNKYHNKLKILRTTSIEAARQIENNSLDFIFLDGNHDYKFIKEDIELWVPKVKQGGLISGHDYTDMDIIDKQTGNKLGVKKAVDEAYPNANILPGTIWWVIK